MDDRHAQFLILIGELCLAAANGKLPVTFETTDGSRLIGIPEISTSPGGDDEVDDTGLAGTIHVDGRPMRLQDILRCTITAPAPSAARHRGLDAAPELG